MGHGCAIGRNRYACATRQTQCMIDIGAEWAAPQRGTEGDFSFREPMNGASLRAALRA
jgi:hypothetical protein